MHKLLLPVATVVACAAIAAVIVSPGAARAAECDVIAADLVRTTGAVFKRRGDMAVYLDHPAAETMYVSCPVVAQDKPQFTIALDSPAPSAEFFDLLGVGGELVIGVPAGTLRSAAIACHRETIRVDHKFGQRHRELRGIRIDCFARTSPAVSYFFMFRLRR